MRKRFLGFGIVLVLFCAFVSVAAFQAQTRRPERASAGDVKVKYKVSVAAQGGFGQTSESTTMIKGARERSESSSGYGGDMVKITQCDLKRIIQISENTKKYVITPMETGDSTPAAGSPGGASAPTGPSRRGGVVTYVTTAVDTGERKEMFGFTARHVKSSMSMESSPDACNQIKQRTETDGWYVDLNIEFNCQTGRPPSAGYQGTQPTCKDQTKVRREGTGKIGYPLIETMKMYGPDGQITFSNTKEVVELSRQPLDAALFDVPDGYAQAQSNQELYAAPSMDSIMSGRPGGQNPTGANSDTPSAANARNPGTIRVGVVQINNKAGRPVSEESLRERLVGQIQGMGIDAVPLNASSPAEAETEAKAKQCDFILYTDIAALKSSAAKKLGGMFGRVAGVEGVDKTEARVDYKLFAVGETSPRLQSSATAKEEGDEASAGTAIDAEAGKVSAEVRKKGRG